MTDRYQTQCPHCGVKFQITDTLLQAANGTVRCGSCLQVFQAGQNLIPLPDTPRTPAGRATAGGARTPSPAAAPTPPARAGTPARPVRPASTPPAATNNDDEDLVDSILREIEAGTAAPRPAATTKPAPAPAARAATTAKPTAAGRPAPTKATPAPAAKTAPGKADEPGWSPPPTRSATGTDPQWAPPPNTDAPKSEEPQWSPPPSARKQAAPASRPGDERNETRISIGAGEINETLLSDEDPFGASGTSQLDIGDNQAAADESWAKQLLGEEDTELSEGDKRVRDFSIKADDLSLTDQTGVQPRGGLAARLAAGESIAAGQARQNRDDLDHELDFLDDGGLTMKDVELPTLDAGEELGTIAFGHEVSWGREVFWGILSSVFALALLAQYLVFNFDTLARDDGWRGFYAAACGTGLCELPGSSDIMRIQGANLVVRSDPSAEGTLIVDAIVYNRAPHAQPFPRLELGFTDSAGNPVAGRIFTPGEYLKGEAIDYGEMPPDTPIHLSLQVRGPGIDTGDYAYQVRFLPALENRDG